MMRSEQDVEYRTWSSYGRWDGIKVARNGGIMLP